MTATVCAYRAPGGVQVDTRLAWPLWVLRAPYAVLRALVCSCWPVLAVGLLALLALLASGCTKAQAQQAQNAIGPGVVFAICVMTTYNHEAAGVPIAQLVSDELAACQGDAASVISVLDANESPALHAHVAHEKPGST